MLCYLSMLVGLVLQRFDGGLAGNWSIVLLSFAILNLACMWDGIVRFVKK